MNISPDSSASAAVVYLKKNNKKKAIRSRKQEVVLLPEPKPLGDLREAWFTDKCGAACW